MNAQPPALTSPISTVDPELTKLDRFFRWLGLAPAIAAGAIEVRIERNDRGGWSLWPANAGASALMGEGETGNFATPTDASRRAAWNCWEVVG